MPSNDTHIPDPWGLEPVETPASGSTSPAAATDPDGPGDLAVSTRRRSTTTTRKSSDFRIGQLFTSGADAQRLERAATGIQRPLGTGRRVAITSVEGGSGKSTLTALMGQAFSKVRSDTTAAIDVALEAGTLAQRLGATNNVDMDALASHIQNSVPDRPWFEGNLETPTAQLLATMPRGATPAADGAFDRAALAISRYCPIALYDCGPGLSTNPSALWAARNSHVVVVVVRAGSTQVAAAAHWATSVRERFGAAGIVAVVETDGRGRHSALRAAASLSAAGVDAYAIGHDRHLATGSVLHYDRVGSRVRLQVLELAAQILERSGGVNAR